MRSRLGSLELMGAPDPAPAGSSPVLAGYDVMLDRRCETPT